MKFSFEKSRTLSVSVINRVLSFVTTRVSFEPPTTFLSLWIYWFFFCFTKTEDGPFQEPTPKEPVSGSLHSTFIPIINELQRKSSRNNSNIHRLFENLRNALQKAEDSSPGIVDEMIRSLVNVLAPNGVSQSVNYVVHSLCEQ